MKKLSLFALAFVLLCFGLSKLTNAGSNYNSTIPFASATNIASGTTTISGGTSGYLLYDNGGLVSETRANVAVPSGYTRVTPNHVISSANFSLTTVSIGTVCTAIDLTHFRLTSTAKSVTLHLEIDLIAGTSAGVQQANVIFYTDSGCTILMGGMGINNADGHQYRSFAGSAVPNGQEFAMNESHVEVFNNGSTTIYAKRVNTVVNGGAALADIEEVISYND